MGSAHAGSSKSGTTEHARQETQAAWPVPSGALGARVSSYRKRSNWQVGRQRSIAGNEYTRAQAVATIERLSRRCRTTGGLLLLIRSFLAAAARIVLTI